MEEADIDSFVMLIAGIVGFAIGIVFIVRRRQIAERFKNEFRTGFGRFGPTLGRSMSAGWMAYVGTAALAISTLNIIRGAFGVIHWLQ